MEMGNAVRIVADGPTARVVGKLPRDIAHDLYMSMSFEHARAIWHPSTLKPWDDGRIGVFKEKSGRFPTGCIPRVSHYLTHFGIPYTVDRRLPPKTADIKFTGKLRKYQTQMLMAALTHPYGILKAVPRSGKTVVAAACIAARGVVPAMFMVNSIDLCHQAVSELKKWLDCPVGLIGDGIYEPEDVTVVSIQSAFGSLVKTGKAKPVKWRDPQLRKEKPLPRHRDAVDLIQRTRLRVLDEVHHSRSPSHQATLKAMESCCYSIGLSATPWSEENDGILIEAAAGPVVYTTTYSDMIAEGWLVEPIIEMVDIPPKKYAARETWAHIYSDYIVNGDFRNQQIVDFSHRMMDEDHTTLIFVSKINHGIALADAIDGAVWVHGKVSGTERHRIWEKFREKEIKVVVSTVGKEGLDIPTLDAVVMACGGRSAIAALQAMPRVLTCAPGKDHAHVLDFYDNAKYLREHSERRLSLYRTEPMFKIKFKERV